MTNTTNPLDSIRAHGWNLQSCHATETLTGELVTRTVIESLSTGETITDLNPSSEGGLERCLRTLERRMARRA